MSSKRIFLPSVGTLRLLPTFQQIHFECIWRSSMTLIYRASYYCHASSLHSYFLFPSSPMFPTYIPTLLSTDILSLPSLLKVLWSGGGFDFFLLSSSSSCQKTSWNIKIRKRHTACSNNDRSNDVIPLSWCTRTSFLFRIRLRLNRTRDRDKICRLRCWMYCRIRRGLDFCRWCRCWSHRIPLPAQPTVDSSALTIWLLGKGWKGNLVAIVPASILVQCTVASATNACCDMHLRTVACYTCCESFYRIDIYFLSRFLTVGWIINAKVFICSGVLKNKYVERTAH